MIKNQIGILFSFFLSYDKEYFIDICNGIEYFYYLIVLFFTESENIPLRRIIKSRENL